MVEAVFDTNVLVNEILFMGQLVGKNIDKCLLKFEYDTMTVLGQSNTISGKTLIPCSLEGKHNKIIVDFNKFANIVKQISKTRPETIFISYKNKTLTIRADKNKINLETYNHVKLCDYEQTLPMPTLIGSVSLKEFSDSVSVVSHVCDYFSRETFPVLANICLSFTGSSIDLYTTDRFVINKTTVSLQDNSNIGNIKVYVSPKFFVLPKTKEDVTVQISLYKKHEKYLGIGLDFNNGSTTVIYSLMQCDPLSYEALIEKTLSSQAFMFSVSNKDINHIVSSIKQFDKPDNSLVNIGVAKNTITFSTPCVSFAVDRIQTGDNNICNIVINKDVLKTFTKTISSESTTKFIVTNNKTCFYENNMVFAIASLFDITFNNGKE